MTAAEGSDTDRQTQQLVLPTGLYHLDKFIMNYIITTMEHDSLKYNLSQHTMD